LARPSGDDTEHAMKLCRFGPPRDGKPGIVRADGSRVNVAAFGQESASS
jgi:hypothetical protein